MEIRNRMWLCYFQPLEVDPKPTVAIPQVLGFRLTKPSHFKGSLKQTQPFKTDESSKAETVLQISKDTRAVPIFFKRKRFPRVPGPETGPFGVHDFQLS